MLDSIYNFLHDNEYYSLLVVIIILWAGILIYINYLRKSVNKLDNNNKENQSKQIE